MAGLFEELRWRGLVHQCTDPALADRLDGDRLTAYIGFDPTADSLHVGSLLQLCMLRHIQRAGHRPIALAGGGTGMIGDPGGKAEERQLLTRERLEANLAGIRPQLARLLDLSEGGGLLVDNMDWLGSLGLLDFLRDVGKHFTVNQMVAKESVRARLEEREHGISFTEFSYMLLQAYDFLQLFDRHGCRLQLGGSDQWGNITLGVDLVRKLRGETAYGLTSPLVLKADGTKFGKTETGTVWLDAARTSPYRFHQFFLQTEDAVVGDYLRYFTWLTRPQVEDLERATRERPQAREAQRALAREVTALVHGPAEAAAAEQAAAVLFGGDLAGLDERSLLDVFAEAPATALARTALDADGLALVEILAATSLCSSRSDARRTLVQRGVSVNGRRQDDPDRRLGPADLLHGRYVLLRKGRRDHHLLRFE